jgi:hypothetical protein
LNMLNKDYENIAPKLEFLKDEIILAQAWKKSHTYIRRHNWYVDILELDCSIVDLEDKLKDWARLIGEGKYKPEPLRIVPAPKNQQWDFPEELDQEASWYPVDESGKRVAQDLRPLAHLSIRDQTLSTAVMLCLADAIETAQGPTDLYDFLEAQHHKVYSYGNRLHCQWVDHANNNKQAKFSWGSSKCYRQYYEDYKLFLRRPKEVCNYYSSSIDPSKELYIVSLDLKKFFNNIDLALLVNELKSLYKDYYNSYKPLEKYKEDTAFWKKVKEIFNWEWSKKDYDQNNEIIKSAKSALGLPQGLVASGLLANAYLVRFDRMIGDLIKTNIKPNIKLLDYCRYVDDIRIVIEAPNEIDLQTFKNEIHEFINSLITGKLPKSQNKIVEINNKKTNIISYQQFSNENNISAVMNSLQHRISGTPDLDSIHQIIGELVSLLRVSDVFIDQRKQKGNFLELSRISVPHLDVRDDTLKRFSATRLVKTLREKKSMTVHSEIINNDTGMSTITAGQMLVHEFETVARNLISVWSYNPSLSLLLKCGFELYPDVNLLKPVIKALEYKLFHDSPERKTAEYIISDLLRSASISIGYQNEKAYPESLDLIAFREELATFSKKLVDEGNEFPWYVKQQAILFLITNNDIGFTFSDVGNELEAYKLLHEAVLYKNKSGHVNNFKKKLATSIVAQQLIPNRQKYTSWFINFMNELNSNEAKSQAIRTLAISRSDLFMEMLRSNRIKGTDWEQLIPGYIRLSAKAKRNSKFNINIKEAIPLLSIIQSENNPFIQENALLLLTRAILKDPDSYIHLKNGNGIENIKVKCENWHQIQNPQFQGLRITWDSVNDENSFNLVPPPNWIEERFQWMYNLGSILRTSIVGGFDFTKHTFLYSEDLGKYKGIKSTTFTRQFSLINQGRGLLDESMPITPWLSEFLYKLLQWPGIKQWENSLIPWKNISNLGDLLKIIEIRIKHQSRIFGKLSQTPMYTLPVSNRFKDIKSKFRFAVVQPLLPQMNDFNAKDPTNWTDEYRKKHRDHLASICHLINKQVQSTIRARKGNDQSDTFEGIDVIVFPELAVHPDDIGILRSLSDNTKAHIFTGLTFLQTKHSSEPINQALWLLRSEHKGGREFIHVYQGKHHMTKPEKKMGIKSHRPYQVIVELEGVKGEPIRIAGAICYDATDLGIAADLRGVSDVFLISAMNKDIQTFDNMVSYLHYHMYQPIILANTGEFGGSTVQAPFSKHQRTIAHVHGNQQIAISIFEIDPSIFKETSRPPAFPDIKTPPAGYEGRK